MTDQDRILELENFIRSHTCGKCDIKEVLADECKFCPAYTILKGNIGGGS